MTKLNHSRLNLKNLDNLKRESRMQFASVVGDTNCVTVEKSRPSPWESIAVPLSPNQDSQLTQTQIVALDILLSGHSNFVIAHGIASPIFGKANATKRKRLTEAQAQLVDQSVTFLKFCASEASKDSMSTWRCLENYCNSHRKNGNRLFDILVTAVTEDGMEKYFWGVLRGDSQKEEDDFGSLIKSCTHEEHPSHRVPPSSC